jgi:hypothetical protein
MLLQPQTLLTILASLLVPLTTTLAWTTTSSYTFLCTKTRQKSSSATLFATSTSRRDLFVGTIASTTGFLLAPFSVEASLLDEYGADPKRTEKIAQSAQVTPPNSVDSKRALIDPTLRSSYYYPTAKKRYLPRIQKVSQEITMIPDAVAAEDWTALEEFSKTADNAILPLQLYQSSLDGQGLSMSADFAKQMKVDALQYEQAYKRFVKALEQRNTDALTTAITDMAVAVADYRQQGRLSDDDGNIPSVEEMRRMTMRRPTLKQSS